MSKIDRAQVQSVISNIDADFQPMEEGERARVQILSSAYLGCEIREVFHVRGRLFAERKGQFIDASDQLIKAAGTPAGSTVWLEFWSLCLTNHVFVLFRISQ